MRGAHFRKYYLRRVLSAAMSRISSQRGQDRLSLSLSASHSSPRPARHHLAILSVNLENPFQKKTVKTQHRLFFSSNYLKVKSCRKWLLGVALELFGSGASSPTWTRHSYRYPYFLWQKPKITIWKTCFIDEVLLVPLTKQYLTLFYNETNQLLQ